MRTSTFEGIRRSGAAGLCRSWKSGALLLTLCLLFHSSPAPAQSAGQQTVSQQIQQLTEAMARIQAQMDESERQLGMLRSQLEELKQQAVQHQPEAVPVQQAVESPSEPASALTAAVQELREQETMTESEVATLEQDKVETESKYPVRITGMLLLNSFVNRGAVDVPTTPSVALPGQGSAGASVRQTVVGIDAEGPHLFGARSYADLRMDFYGNAGTNSGQSYSGYSSTTAPLRLRTAHAGLEWNRMQAYFSLDRPILSPNTPTSLTAVAVPALAWSGNLSTWNPQAGVNAYSRNTEARGMELQAALIDTLDAPLSPEEGSSNPTGISPSAAEQSSKPGVETRIAIRGSLRNEDRNELGVGGYFAPHQTGLGRGYDSWAATFDERLLLPARLQLTGTVYRGSALGGLGGGGYKDFAYKTNPLNGGYYFRPLDDAGGWAQLKERFSERLEANGAVGIDNVFAGELRPYFAPGGSLVENLARNRTYTGNIIYKPSAYLLFSFEYRHLESVPVIGSAAISNVFGVAAGYKY
jgi:hypothetical protein